MTAWFVLFQPIKSKWHGSNLPTKQQILPKRWLMQLPPTTLTAESFYYVWDAWVQALRGLLYLKLNVNRKKKYISTRHQGSKTARLAVVYFTWNTYYLRYQEDGASSLLFFSPFFDYYFWKASPAFYPFLSNLLQHQRLEEKLALGSPLLVSSQFHTQHRPGELISAPQFQCMMDTRNLDLKVRATDQQERMLLHVLSYFQQPTISVYTWADGQRITRGEYIIHVSCKRTFSNTAQGLSKKNTCHTGM